MSNNTVHRVSPGTISRIISRQAYVSGLDDKGGRRAGAHLALKGVAEGVADVLAKLDQRFDRVRFLRECGVR